MAQTALFIKGRKIVVRTHVENDKVMAIMANADENYSMINDVEAIAYVVENGTEKDFHVQLRKGADEQGHYERQYSTDPEWNPENYGKGPKNEDRTPVQGC